MTQLITSIVERLAFPGMEILLKHEYVPVEHYDASPEEMRQRLWGEATSDSGNRQVVTIQELCGLLGAVDPTALASAVDAAAHIAAVLLGLRRVVNNHELYKHLEARFGIRLSSQAPRLEGMHLKFLTMIFEGGDLRTGRLGVNTGLHDVDIDIPRAQVTVARIPQP